MNPHVAILQCSVLATDRRGDDMAGHAAVALKRLAKHTFMLIVALMHQAGHTRRRGRSPWVLDC